MLRSRLCSWLPVVAIVLSLSACSGQPADSDSTVNTPGSDFDAIATPDAATDEGVSGDSNLALEPLPPLKSGEAIDSARTDPSTGIKIVPEGEEPTADEPIAEIRTTPEGRWEVVVHVFQFNLIAMLLDVQKTDEGYVVESMGDSVAGWTLDEATIDDDKVHLKITDPENVEIDYVGHLEDGLIRGNIAFAEQGLDLATLRPTNRERVEPEQARQTAPGFEKVASLQPDENLLANLRSIARDLGDSPLAYELYVRLFNLLRNQPASSLDESELVKEYLAAAEGWGDRVQNRVSLDIGYTLAIIEKSPELAREYLDKAAEGLSGNESDVLQAQLKLADGLLLINSDSEDDQQRGLALLKENREQDPFNLVSVVRMAEYYETHENPEEALALYAGIQTIPGVQGDPSRVANLWKDLGRDPQELESYLDEVYENTVYRFAETDIDSEAVPDDQQVVLCELLTGASCPPCVAADIATGGLEMTYPLSKLIVLRYHEHVPAPDPLTIPAGENRMQYYEARGTPSLYLNGTNVQGVGGGIFNAAPLYRQLSEMVGPLTEQTTDLTIELSANADNDSLQVSASVGGTEEILQTWRLRLCLVEEAVHYTAPNGIRVHEMLVRYMPGGAEGVVPQEDGFTFETEVTTADLYEAIQSTIEAAKDRYNVDLPMIPIGSGELHLVAFVQDDLSLEVKQAASIPVNGFNTAPPEAVEVGEGNNQNREEGASSELPAADESVSEGGPDAPVSDAEEK